jgi:serine/threonine protein kinase
MDQLPVTKVYYPHTSLLPAGTCRLVSGYIDQEIKRPSPYGGRPGQSSGRWTYVQDLHASDNHLYVVQDRHGKQHVAKYLECPEQGLAGAMEVDMLLHFRHPHIIPAYEAIVDIQQDVLLVMPRAQDTVRTGVSWHEAMGVWRQVLSAVVYLEEHHIIHADLKPQNIGQWSTSAGPAVQLLDFGAALYLDPIDQSRTVTNRTTQSYAAPELLDDDEQAPYTFQSETWSLGLLLLELLRGRPLYDTCDEHTLREQHRQLCADLAGQVRRLFVADQAEYDQLVASAICPEFAAPPPLELQQASIEVLQHCLPYDPQQRCPPSKLYQWWFGPLQIDPYIQSPNIRRQMLAESPKRVRSMVSFLCRLLWHDSVEAYSLALDLLLRYLPYARENRSDVVVSCAILACQLTDQERDTVDFYQDLLEVYPHRQTEVEEMFGQLDRVSTCYWRIVAALSNLCQPHLYTACTTLGEVAAVLSLVAEDEFLVRYSLTEEWPTQIKQRSARWSELTDRKEALVVKEVYQHLAV